MGTTIKREGGAGFAIVEAVLIIVIILGVVGAGFYVYTKNHKNSTNNATTTASTTTNVPINGTTSSVDQAANAEAQSESSAETAADAQNQQVVTNANSAASNVGGAYNENNF
jgi:cytoskeletal protein RodZ